MDAEQYYGSIVFSKDTPPLDFAYILDFDDTGVLKSPFETAGLLTYAKTPDEISIYDTEFKISMNGFAEEISKNVDLKASGKYLAFKANAGYSKKYGRNRSGFKVSLILRKFYLVEAERLLTILPKKQPQADPLAWITTVKDRGNFYVNRIAQGAIINIEIDLSSLSEETFEKTKAHVDAEYSSIAKLDVSMINEINSAISQGTISYKSTITGTDLKTATTIETSILPSTDSKTAVTKFDGFLQSIVKVTEYLGDASKGVIFKDILWWYNKIPTGKIPEDIKFSKLLEIQEKWREANDAIILIDDSLSNTNPISSHIPQNWAVQLKTKKNQIEIVKNKLEQLHEKIKSSVNPNVGEVLPSFDFDIKFDLPRMWAIRMGDAAESGGNSTDPILQNITWLQNQIRVNHLDNIFDPNNFGAYDLGNFYLVYCDNGGNLNSNWNDLNNKIIAIRKFVSEQGPAAFRGLQNKMQIVDLQQHCKNLNYIAHFVNHKGNNNAVGNQYQCFPL